VVFAVVHFVLAMLYAANTPFLKPGFLKFQSNARTIDVGAPDELQHIVYVRRIASGGGIPVLRADDPDLDRTYQSHQPPLYYFVAAAWSKVAGESALGMRSLNCLIGAATVVGAFFLAWWGLRREDVAIGAAAFAALLPMNVALSSAVTNDTLLFCLCTWSMALFARLFREGIDTKGILIAGAITGLAFVTKTNAVALIPAIGLGWISCRSRVTMKSLAPGLGVALAIGAIWWIRNTMVYGDPFAMKVFNEAFEPRIPVKPAQFVEALGVLGYWGDMVGWWTARSFIGVFGYMDIFLGDKFYRIALAILVLIGVLGLASFRDKPDSEAKPVHWMNGTFLVVTILLFLQFNTIHFQGQARYLIPAIGPISVLMGLGLASVYKARPHVPAFCFSAVLLGLNAYILQVLPEEFARRIDYAGSVRQTSEPRETSK
jgi:4-amino-4-deoxy-L-arabinose transferase-like glycosyltransferase